MRVLAEAVARLRLTENGREASLHRPAVAPFGPMFAAIEVFNFCPRVFSNVPDLSTLPNFVLLRIGGIGYEAGLGLQKSLHFSSTTSTIMNPKGRLAGTELRRLAPNLMRFVGMLRCSARDSWESARNTGVSFGRDLDMASTASANTADGVHNNIRGNLNIFQSPFYGRKCHCDEIGDVNHVGMKSVRRTESLGPGYFLHAGEIKGRAVLLKVFNQGPTARKQLESTVALAKGFMHPNVLRIEGASSPEASNHFIAYENAHWKTAECPLAAALEEDLMRSITLGFKMVAGLSVGLI
ncbi:hypothetical protein FB451DRAFT_1377122 [Mycena latifolia]|nr:hypothetical protein FB451DRAFT_1377122 [Mycena latifolia]